jgi:hypothetical protein
VSGIVPVYRLGDHGLKSRNGLGNYLFTTASRPAMGPTQPPFQWVSGDTSQRIMRPGCEADLSLPSSV